MNIITDNQRNEQLIRTSNEKLSTLTHLGIAIPAVISYTSHNFDDTSCEFWGDIDDVRNQLINSISIDAEWYEKPFEAYEFEGEITSLLTAQGTCMSDGETVLHILIWNKNYKAPTDMWKSMFATEHGPLLFVESNIGDDSDRICSFLNLFQLLQLQYTRELKIYMYYSPRDITATLTTRGAFRDAVREGLITKKRNVSGKYLYEEYGVTLNFKDLIGAFNSSLDQAFDLVGLRNTTKDLIHKDLKSKMDEAIIMNPDKFATYAMGDTKDLFKLWDLRVRQVNKIVENSLDFNPNFTTDNCPRTSGKLVSDTMCLWLEAKYPALMIAIEYLAHTTSNLKHKQRVFSRELVNQKENILSSTLIELPKGKNKTMMCTPVDIRKKYFITFNDKYGQSISGLARGSISALGALSNNDQSLNAIVNGGRCNNEHHREFQISDVFDIDMSSCYGTTLRDLDFPIGRPRNVEVVRTYNGKEKQRTLREIINIYEDKFIDGLWQLVLESPKDKDGKPKQLSFDQDLLYSKIGVTQETIREDLKKGVNQDKWDDSEFQSLADVVDFAHISGEFKILKREFKNVILTSHSLKVLKNVCSQRELKQILDMLVVAGVYYDRSDKVSTDELFDILTDDRKRGAVETSKEDVNFSVDNRTTKWTSVPLENFIGKFIDYRSVLKRQIVNKGDSFDIEQTAVKLFINTLYGCLASPYFPISNAILANNITDKARVGVWLINKSLGTVQSITDGGAYSNDGVRFLKTDLAKFKKEKPTLNDFSDYELLNNNKCIKVDKLIHNFAGIYQDLKINDKNTQKLLDETALNRINCFWSNYNLELPFGVEHKYGNTCERLIYGNSSDYLMLKPVKPNLYAEIEQHQINKIVSGKELKKLNEENLIVPYTIKVRAAKQHDHVNKKWLFYLAGLITKPNSSYDYKQIIGVGQLREALLSANPPAWAKVLVAGETLKRTTVHKPTTSKIQPVETETDFTLCKRRKSNRDISYKKLLVDNPDLIYGLLNNLNQYFDEESKKVYYNFLRDGDDVAFEINKTGRSQTRNNRGKYKRSSEN
jgi:hypothetical protein